MQQGSGLTEARIAEPTRLTFTADKTTAALA